MLKWMFPRSVIGFYVFLMATSAAGALAIHFFVERLPEFSYGKPSAGASGRAGPRDVVPGLGYNGPGPTTSGPGPESSNAGGIGETDRWLFSVVVAVTSSFIVITCIGSILQWVTSRNLSLDMLSFFSVPNTLLILPGTGATVSVLLLLLAVLIASGTVVNALRFQRFGASSDLKFAAASGPAIDLAALLENSRLIQWIKNVIRP